MLIIHRRAVTILITVLCMLGILGLPGVAWGHASLIQSSPEANAVLEEAPERVELTFNEPLTDCVHVHSGDESGWAACRYR